MNTPSMKENDNTPQVVTLDAIMPATMAARAEEAGVKRAAMDPLTVFVLSMLGGAFVAFGAIFATTVSAGNFTMVAVDGAAALSVALPLRHRQIADRSGVLRGSDPGRGRRRRVVHRQQHDRDGLGKPQGDNPRLADELDHCLRR